MSVRKALQTPSDINVSGWYSLLPEPPPPKILDGRRKADWVVIGAGFAGLSAARRLSQLVPGERIAVLEAQRVGWGAAGRNTGAIHADLLDVVVQSARDSCGSA